MTTPVSELSRLSREYGIEKVFRAILARSLAIGIGLGIARFLLLLGVVALLLSSYALWGSPRTPLRFLAMPGCMLIASGWIIRLVLHRVMQWTSRAERVHARRLLSREEIRRSRIVPRE